jgi:hypothetical protein
MTPRRISAPALAGSLSLLLAFALPVTAADTCSARSPAQRVALLELYTSEGCSSCPPADAWLKSLPGLGLKGEQVIPLALHVDYWNDLGWPDPFSQKLFTQRQYRTALLGGTTTVYTPQVLLNGKEYRWHRQDIRKTAQQINGQPARADIQLKLTQKQPNQLTVVGETRVAPSNPPKPTGLYLAVYENNLTNHIRAGENRGLTLQHQYVVRRLLGPYPVGAGGSVRVEERLDIDSSWKARDLGVVAFVEQRDTGEVLQALALSCEPPAR